MIPLVQVRDVRKTFRRLGVAAVDDVSFDIAPGETLGLVGESGSGKSTLGRIVVGLMSPTAGEVVIGGQRVGAGGKALWRQVQMVFQDPFSSLDPRMTVRDILAEPLRNFGIARGADATARIGAVLDACGLGGRAAERYPSDFSGGQRQRIGIARALIVRPAFIVADEPVSALDVSIQAQIVNLLQDLKTGFGLTYLFISHDLAVIRHMADRVAVMYRGRIVEIGRTETLYRAPLHPYTRLLLRSVPIPDPRAEAARLAQRVPSVAETTFLGGCPFRARCPDAVLPACATAPSLTGLAGGRSVACHLVQEQKAAA